MANKKHTEEELWAHEQLMIQWRHNYPLTSALMSDTKLSDEQVNKLVKLGKERRNDK